MIITSRWSEPIPNCSLQQWIFGSPSAALSDNPIFIDPDRPDTHYVTMSDYRLLAKRVALGLQRRGLKPGDRVLVFSGNNIFFPPVFLGILMAGCIFTGANPTYVSRELAYQLSNSGASVMIAAKASLDTALDAAKQVGLPISNILAFDADVVPGPEMIPQTGGSSSGLNRGVQHWTTFLAPSTEAEKFQWIEPVDSKLATCCLNYSSGTTGVPKGVEVSHYNYVANGAGVVRVSTLAEDYESSIPRLRGICFLPMYHAYAQTYFVANFAKQGMPVYVMPSFDLVKLLSHIQKFRITHLPAVPPVLVALTKQPVAKKFDLSSLELVGSGAAPLAPETSAETERLLNKPDLIVRQGWGMTELTCTALSWDPRRDERGNNAVGELMPNCRAKLVDSDGREVDRPKEPGELWISGPTVMCGYWNNPKATAETIVIDSDGSRWLRTGDVAYVDSSRPGALFFIVDRIKELIKVKGNQVAPAELEALLLERQDIADAAVIGVTIEGEEVPRAYVVPIPGSKVSGEEIAEWLAGRVARHKRLKGGVCFVDAIPKNPSGKILRKVLREKAKKEMEDSKPVAKL
ncbi:AMP-binding enzyme [Mariannaea sp. PMI_226]|nr:AMP-binding enzyme [Mariannaea sp. PMI_226]